MGSASSRDAAASWPGFVPKFHMIRLAPEDMHRLFVPRNIPALCGLGAGDLMAFEDCAERTFKVCLESTDGQFYLGTGWGHMLRETLCFCGDIMLLHIKSVRCCKVYIFCGATLGQRYPILTDPHLVGRTPTASNGGGDGGDGFGVWPDFALGEGSQANPIDVDGSDEDDAVTDDLVYNVSGRELDQQMRDFFEHISTHFSLRAPMYYCQFGLVETDSEYFVFGEEYGRMYLLDEIEGYDQAQLHHGVDEPILVDVHVNEMGGIVLGSGWDVFVRDSNVPKMTELVFCFDWSDEDDGLHVYVYDF